MVNFAHRAWEFTVKRILTVSAALMLGGCAGAPPIVDPASITLSKAMTDTIDALADAEEQGRQRHTNYHLFACSVTAVYTLNASQTVDQKVAIGVSGGPPAAIAPVSVSVNDSNEVSKTGSRGNTVTVLLARPECFPKPVSTGAVGGTPVASPKRREAKRGGEPVGASIAGRPVATPAER